MTQGIGLPPPQSIPDKLWIDTSTGNSYQQNPNGGWIQISSGNRGSSNVQNGNDLTSLVASLIGTANKGLNYQDIINSQTKILQPNYPAGSFNTTPFKQFYDKAYQQLAPYYKQLLDEAGGDLKVALGNLEQDYVIGKRTKIEDFMADMDKLGIVFPKEQTNLQGTLNQRGIALTENPQGQTTYAGGGQAQKELGALNIDQMLRKEAVERTKQRGLESVAINKLRGEQTAQQQYRDKTEELRSEQESRATQLGGQFQAADLASKQAGIDAAERQAKYGTTTQRKNVNPRDVGSIKSAYKGYAGWNDPNAIMADYAATLGVGKE